MKFLLSIFSMIILSGCSSDQFFDCEGRGLVISNKTATYGPTKLKLCNETGVKSTYSNDCDLKNYILDVDTVTYSVISFNRKNLTGSVDARQCVKIVK